jgi:hypothetical protein
MMPSSLSFASLRIWSGISGEGEAEGRLGLRADDANSPIRAENFEPHQTMLFQAGSLNPLWDVKM